MDGVWLGVMIAAVAAAGGIAVYVPLMEICKIPTPAEIFRDLKRKKAQRREKK